LPKGTLIHRCLGYFWMAAMVIVALTSFFITSLHWFGPFGPIHILSVLVLWSIFQSIRFARAGQIKRHMSSLIQLYVLGLIITGGFTLLPGRVMHQVVFGGWGCLSSARFNGV